VRYGIYDVETFSTLNLRLFGAYNYARDPSTDIWFVSYCIVIDGVPGPILTWQPGEPPPAEIIDLHADPEALIGAFPDAFERQIHNRSLARATAGQSFQSNVGGACRRRPSHSAYPRRSIASPRRLSSPRAKPHEACGR
jgi:hypothetical protein